jgi:hypothetical protein
VQWIFARRLEGWSTAAIARTLNALGVTPPSGHDRARNPHRSGTTWCLRTIAAILANPRYTGRQVWNRQGINHHETTPGTKVSRPTGGKPTHGWNPRDQWEYSTRTVHPPLISETDFLAAQQITALPQPDDGNHQRYRLTGLIICGLCGRRAEGHWAHGRARYRRRHGHASASAANPYRLKTLYIREDHALAEATKQYADTPAGFAAQLRRHGITIICTPVSITLDPGAGADQDSQPENAAAPTATRPNAGPKTVQPAIPGLRIPRQWRTRNPHQSHPQT